MKVYLFCSFHLEKLFRQHSLVSAMLFSGGAAAFVGFGLLLYWSGQYRELDEALNRARIAPPPQADAVRPTSSPHPLLPTFSSGEFAGQFAVVVKELGLSSDEVTYALDTGSGEPYWRYRISLQVQSGYPAIRKFVAAVAGEFPNVVLDSIQCQRENAGAAALKCELALSAFFQKPVKHG